MQKCLPISVLLCVAVLGPLVSVCAQRLPVKTYTTTDGLARDDVQQIVADSRGYLWFCTAEGLSRFDGHRFVNYGVADGLPGRAVYDLLETRNGDYFVATNGGVSRLALEQNAAAKFVSVAFDGAAPHVRDLLEDRAGNVWIGAESGLHQLEQEQGTWRAKFIRMSPLAQSNLAESELAVNGLSEDGAGALWVTTATALYRRWPDGRVERFSEQEGLPENFLTTALLTDSQGRRWLGTKRGLYQLASDLQPGHNVVTQIWLEPNGSALGHINALLETKDRRLLIATSAGLRMLRLDAEVGSQTLRTYAYDAGLRDPVLFDITEDRECNLWLASENGGAVKISSAGFTSWNLASAAGNYRSIALFTDQRGRFYWHSGYLARQYFHRFADDEFTQTELTLPRQIRDRGWGWQQWVLSARNGEWWVPTGDGLLRYAPLDRLEDLPRTQPLAHYTVRDGLPSDEIFRLYEDRRGDVWISTLENTQRSLARWERATATFHSYPIAKDELPSAASAFTESAAGQMWIGFYGGGIARQTAAGWQLFKTQDGVPKGFIRNLYFDRRHRLWIATSEGGVARVDDPEAAQPHFVVYTTAQGLASNQVTCVTEDQWGHIYLGTGRGLDLLEVESGRIKHFTTADGLASNFINVSFRTADGALWFGTLQGISRLMPRVEPAGPPPPVYLSALRVAGIATPLPEFGATQFTLPELTPDKNQLDIEFIGLSYASNAGLSYQYKLEGAAGDWSLPFTQRELTFANLAPGTYRLLIRALGADGTPSTTPATLSFTVLPPFYLRWWFLTMAAALIGGLLFAFERYRVSRLLELERVRMRIATDLHDDIGAGLSRIAILSEVAHGRIGTGDLRGREHISTIANASRELLDSMSDIVWAINPQKEHLEDLAQRMRRFAQELLSARNIILRMQAPENDADLKLPVDVRREVFLIFKESINNLAKHSGATEAHVELKADKGSLWFEIRDNGQGFDAAACSARDWQGEGNGLASMRDRAMRLGGEWNLVSQPGAGTTIQLRVPLQRRWWQEQPRLEDPRRRKLRQRDASSNEGRSFFSFLRRFTKR